MSKPALTKEQKSSFRLAALANPKQFTLIGGPLDGQNYTADHYIQPLYCFPARRTAEDPSVVYHIYRPGDFIGDSMERLELKYAECHTKMTPQSIEVERHYVHQ